jgi:hypothetical protein
LIFLDDVFRIKLKNKVVKAFIEQAEKLNNQPGLMNRLWGFFGLETEIDYLK